MRELAFMNPEVTIELIDAREEDEELGKEVYHFEGGVSGENPAKPIARDGTRHRG